MSTYTQILYQIVFSTKGRSKSIDKNSKQLLYNYIYGILVNKNCILFGINGIEDHIHIILYLHPSIGLSKLVKDIKLSSTHFIKKNKLFPNFNGWQSGYAAFTYSQEAKVNLIQYVRNQEVHHLRKSYRQELRDLLEEHEIKFEEKYLF